MTKNSFSPKFSSSTFIERELDRFMIFFQETNLVMGKPRSKLGEFQMDFMFQKWREVPSKEKSLPSLGFKLKTFGFQKSLYIISAIQQR
jgi:hypothetical protein